MKQIINLLSIAGLLTVAAGCASTPRDSIPATTINGTLNGAPFSFAGPKDLTAGAINITASNATGYVTMSITNLAARTNPDVVSMSADSYAKAITAQGDALTKVIAAAGAAGGTIAGAAIKAP